MIKDWDTEEWKIVQRKKKIMKPSTFRTKSYTEGKQLKAAKVKKIWHL